jgi:hypothetical protein
MTQRAAMEFAAEECAHIDAEEVEWKTRRDG